MGGAAAALLLVVSVPGVLGTGGIPGPWARFRGEGVSFDAPAGWVVADPFVPDTPRMGQLWFHDVPPAGTRRALVRDPGFGTQVLLELGEASALRAQVGRHEADYARHPLLEGVASQPERTADGRTVKVAVVRLRAGLLAGEEAAYLLGFAELGERALVVNAGGPAARFDVDAVLRIIRSLRLGE